MRVGVFEPSSLYSSARSEMSSSGQSHENRKSKVAEIHGRPVSLVVTATLLLGSNSM